MIRIDALGTADPIAVEALLDAAFGPDRKARTAYRLREGAAAISELSFAAFDDTRLIGSLQSWPVTLRFADTSLPLAMVGPVAVAPGEQGHGIGKALMARLLAAAGDRPLMMIGDPDYYGRFGFAADATAGWQAPGPVERHRLLARGAPTDLAGRLMPSLA